MSAKQGWLPTDATIFAADYLDPGGKVRPVWRITYSYRIGHEYYSGQCWDFATDKEVEYHKDDVLKIEYSAANPEKSRVNGLTTHWQKTNSPFLVYASAAVIVLLIVVIVLSHLYLRQN